MPWCQGDRPVKRHARVGVLLGVDEYPFVNSVPSAANASMWGVMTAGFPIQFKASPRCWSDMIRMMCGFSCAATGVNASTQVPAAKASIDFKDKFVNTFLMVNDRIFCRAMDECVMMVLVHSGTARMVFLQWSVSQIDRKEEQTVGHSRERGVSVGERRALSSAMPFPVHFMRGRIIFVRFLKTREMCAELLTAKLRQDTETVDVVFMFVAIHETKIMNMREIWRIKSHRL